MKKTVLIFGISSFVGSNLAESLMDEFRIIGTYHHTPVEIPGITCVPCDVLKKDLVNYLMGLFKPDVTIYAIGLSSLKECQLYPRRADSINTQGALTCSGAAERNGSKFIFLSSGYVLGGENILYKEGDSPFPLTTYGSTLTATEFHIQRFSSNYLILRCSALYGRSFNHSHPNWFEVVQNAFARGLPLACDESAVMGFLDIHALGSILKELLASEVVNRLFHVSSKDSVTRYEFARNYAKIFKKDETLLQKVSGVFPIEKSRKSKDSDSENIYFHLDVTNLESFLNTQMPTVEESLVLTYRRLQGSFSGKSSSQTL